MEGASPVSVALRFPVFHVSDANSMLLTDDRFNDLCEAFRSTGGVIGAEELASTLQRSHGQGVGLVARWIVDGHLISFHWRGGYWIPRFQLLPTAEHIAPQLPPVLAELPHTSDALSRAEWFADANAALDGERPCDVLARAPQRVREAARMLRFAVDG
ncbi:hypothetical protein EIP75_11095 [Aquabacterium soli]|uniref:Uncharacterized protein n=1 Tax=Aquabacterium soli TaxID=2493092 RepID=A0A3R8S355_9BURK|nr:hypothetical protein [Aquabacterium soli]RRS04424.1 hypothetical protein EIP75_11095 [Aquabacterium soli]